MTGVLSWTTIGYQSSDFVKVKLALFLKYISTPRDFSLRMRNEYREKRNLEQNTTSRCLTERENVPHRSAFQCTSTISREVAGASRLSSLWRRTSPHMTCRLVLLQSNGGFMKALQFLLPFIQYESAFGVKMNISLFRTLSLFYYYVHF
jgi:hypothetical protein